MKIVRNILFFTALMMVLVVSSSRAGELSEQSKISIITCGTGPQIHALYGHTAIRVVDPARGMDLVFNYGVFSFFDDSFIYRFAKGETDYMLYPYSFADFYQDYVKHQRSIFEQDLNLTQKEKQQMFDFLAWNAREENRVYRYNYFFDNCASRVRDVVVKQVNGKIHFPEKSEHPQTFRQLVDAYHGKDLWLTFGIDLVVAAPADREATAYEEMFLPDFLMKYFSQATIQDETGSRPLVAASRILFEAPKSAEEASYVTPFVVFGLVLLLIIWLTYLHYKTRRMGVWLDCLVYGLNGFLGLAISWFVLYSVHPAMHPNYNLLWAMPLNLLFALVWMVKVWRPVTKYYHVFMTGWILLFIILGFFLPQTFHVVDYLIAAMVLCRSALHTLRIYQVRYSK